MRLIRIDGSGDEARALVLRAADQLGKMSVLEFEVDFDPEDPEDPGGLHDLLQSRGLVVQAFGNDRRPFCLVIRHVGSPAVLDLSDLEAPLPMETILEASAALRAGESLFARTPCFPRPLLSLLDRRELHWEAVEDSGGCGLVWVGRPD